MPRHAYVDLPAHCFWRESVATPPPQAVDPVVGAKFRIARSDRVATAGSCFAQHIARWLASAGFTYLVTETAHPAIGAHFFKDFNYGVFTARFGNVYTARQLRQLLARAYGEFSPAEELWDGEGGRAVDPFRPAIQPRGFASRAEFFADRAQHFAAVRRMVEEMDVFVFTLGLTEAWESRIDGAVFPLCPGVAGGVFARERHAFRNFGVGEVVADMTAALDFLRARNPRVRTILTVSPVPLAATAEDRHVLVSTAYSKSVLRVAAEEIARSRDDVAYFPSYEIVTGAHARGAYFAPDLRSVTEEGVAHVMRLFLRHYGAEETTPAPAAAPAPDASRAVADAMQAAAQTVCEEEMLANR